MIDKVKAHATKLSIRVGESITYSFSSEDLSWHFFKNENEEIDVISVKEFEKEEVNEG